MINNRKCYILSVIIFLFIGISQPISAQSTDIQKGEASWYGSKYHGRPTSSGEPYNKNEMTAAHKTLPFGTKVNVINLKHGKSVKVRINDRGPFIPGRIIDLSRKAARRIDMINDGVGNVKIKYRKKKG